MKTSERFVVLVPLLVTVVVVLVVDHGATEHGGLVPFLGQAATGAWLFVHKVVGS